MRKPKQATRHNVISVRLNDAEKEQLTKMIPTRKDAGDFLRGRILGADKEQA